MKFTLHTQDSAPEESKPLLAKVEAAFGFVPNLTATLAESSAVLAGHLQLSSAIEQQARHRRPSNQETVSRGPIATTYSGH